MNEFDEYCSRCPFIDSCRRKDDTLCIVKVLMYEAELKTHPTWRVESRGKHKVLVCPYCGYVRETEYLGSHGKPPYCEHCGSELRKD